MHFNKMPAKGMKKPMLFKKWALSQLHNQIKLRPGAASRLE